MLTQPPTRSTRDGVPARTLTFLIRVNASIEARAALMDRGYTQAEHEHAWTLLAKLGQLPASAPIVDKAVQAAVAELNAWDEPNFSLIEAILLRSYPDQAAFVFQDLAPSPIGAEAVLAISTLLDRLDALESSKERKATRAVDKQAIERLAARGYTQGERARLRALVTTAQTVTAVTPLSTTDSDAIKVELYGFLTEWTTQAKTSIKRRDILIRMGIGKRKRRAAAPPAPPPVRPPPAPPPVQTAPTPPAAPAPPDASAPST